jgi:hypothetical protein
MAGTSDGEVACREVPPSWPWRWLSVRAKRERLASKRGSTAGIGGDVASVDEAAPAAPRQAQCHGHG